MKPVAFRNLVMVVPALLAGAATFVFFIVAAFSNPMISDLPGAFIFDGFIYFFWLIGWHTAVRLGPAGVTVDNLLKRDLIPWEELSDIAVGSGLEFRLRDGGKVGSLMYGGSLIGMISGYPYTRKVAARMLDASAELIAAAPETAGPLEHSSRFYLSPWPPLVILAATELVAVLALTIR
jgi:hypothetical protein